MPQTPATPNELIHWLSNLRDGGGLDPIVVVVRGDRVIASGHPDRASWTAIASIGFYGFGADAIAFAMDGVAYDGGPPLPAGLLPMRMLTDAGVPGTRALWLQWLPRTGPTRLLVRGYVEADGRVDWSPVNDLGAGSPFVRPDVVQGVVERVGVIHAPADFFDDIPRADRDRATATYLGLELHTLNLEPLP